MEASSADSTPSPQRSATVSRRHVLSRSSQSLAISQPSPSPQTSGAGPPPSTQVSWPSSMSFVKETQRPSTHMLLAQSLATRHAAPPPHGAQPLAPPQSTPDSSPSLTPFVQEKQTPTVTVTGAVHAQSSVAGVRVRVHRQAGRRVGEAGARVLEADTTVRLRAGGGGVQARAPAAVDVGLVPVRQGVVGREAGVVVAGELVAVDVAAVDVGLHVVLDAVAAVLQRRHHVARPRRHVAVAGHAVRVARAAAVRVRALLAAERAAAVRASLRAVLDAGNRRFCLLSALRTHTKPPIQTRVTMGNAEGA